MLKRIISLFLAFWAGLYAWYEITETESYKNAQTHSGPNSGLNRYGNFAASCKLGEKAGEEIALKYYSKFSK